MKHEAAQLSRWLRRLPTRVPSAELRTSLRLIAGRERQRRLARRNPGSIFQTVFQTMFRTWRDRVQVLGEHVMRSFVLPMAGGLSSAVVLFAMFVVPAYPLRVPGAYDIPTELTTKVALKVMAPFVNSDGDLVVDVRVDGQDRMIDYVIVSGGVVLTNMQMRRRLWFSSSHIDVRG